MPRMAQCQEPGIKNSIGYRPNSATGFSATTERIHERMHSCLQAPQWVAGVVVELDAAPWQRLQPLEHLQVEERLPSLVLDIMPRLCKRSDPP
jgi:hypothetical protein